MNKILLLVSLSLGLFSACAFANTDVPSDITNPFRITTDLSPSTGTGEILTPTGSGALVTSAADGDTIRIILDDKRETVRLIGIDTPETVDPRKPVQCFGKEASKKTKALVTNRIVHLASDPTQADRDTYGRLLRYVFLPDGRLLNELLIREGYGFEYTYKVPYMKQQEFKAAEKEAKESQKGLWADTTCKGTYK